MARALAWLTRSRQKPSSAAESRVAYDGTATADTGTGSASANNAFSGSGLWRRGDDSCQTGVPAGYVLPWPNFSAGAYPNPNFPAILNGPTSVVDQNAGRPARQIQWSVGLQREVRATRGGSLLCRQSRRMVAEHDSRQLQRALGRCAQGCRPGYQQRRGSRDSPRDIGSSAAGRFQNKLPYAGFPLTSTVAQSLRPFPQFTSGLAPLWAPQGRTWYDSLQAKVTQRVWHGLEAQYAFTWSKELQMGTEAFRTVNDVFNRSQNKTISGFSRPLVSVISINYRVPAPQGNKIVSLAVRDWAFGSRDDIRQRNADSGADFHQ